MRSVSLQYLHRTSGFSPEISCLNKQIPLKFWSFFQVFIFHWLSLAQSLIQMFLSFFFGPSICLEGVRNKRQQGSPRWQQEHQCGKVVANRGEVSLASVTSQRADSNEIFYFGKRISFFSGESLNWSNVLICEHIFLCEVVHWDGEQAVLQRSPCSVATVRYLNTTLLSSY